MSRDARPGWVQGNLATKGGMPVVSLTHSGELIPVDSLPSDVELQPGSKVWVRKGASRLRAHEIQAREATP